MAMGSLVLIVDSIDAHADELERELRLSGHRTLRATNVHEGVLSILYAAEAIDLVAINLTPSRQVWDDFLRKLRFATDPGASRPWPMIVCTSSVRFNREFEYQLHQEGAVLHYE